MASNMNFKRGEEVSSSESEESEEKTTKKVISEQDVFDRMKDLRLDIPRDGIPALVERLEVGAYAVQRVNTKGRLGDSSMFFAEFASGTETSENPVFFPDLASDDDRRVKIDRNGRKLFVKQGRGKSQYLPIERGLFWAVDLPVHTGGKRSFVFYWGTDLEEDLNGFFDKIIAGSYVLENNTLSKSKTTVKLQLSYDWKRVQIIKGWEKEFPNLSTDVKSGKWRNAVGEERRKWLVQERQTLSSCLRGEVSDKWYEARSERVSNVSKLERLERKLEKEEEELEELENTVIRRKRERVQKLERQVEKLKRNRWSVRLNAGPPGKGFHMYPSAMSCVTPGYKDHLMKTQGLREWNFVLTTPAPSVSEYSK